MKKILILFTALWLMSCSSDDDAPQTPAVVQQTYIRNPEELAAFIAKNITHLEGSLSITGQIGSNDLAGLESLQEIDGTLDIRLCPNLIKLSGLKNLVKAGNITVLGNPKLISLDGLAGLTTVSEELYVTQNDVLENLTGLENLSSVKRLTIYGAFKNILALHNITTAESIYIATSSLTSLDGLNNLTSVKKITLWWVKGSLQALANLTNVEVIELTNTQLTNVQGLENVTELKALYLEGNYGLTGLTGLQNLQKVDLLVLTGNRIAAFSDLQSLTTIGTDIENGGIYIWDNRLESLDGLEHITSFKGSLIIEEDVTNFCPLQTILTTGDLGPVNIQRYGKPVPTVQDIINGNCTAD